MKTLHLNLKKKWFDIIHEGVKLQEYREISEYWRDRLMVRSASNLFQFRQDFKTVTFSNGYSKTRKQIKVELLRISIDEGIEAWGAEPGKKYFVLQLGSIILRN